MAGNKAKPPEVWDRQAKESLRAFKCFCVYRDMPYKDADNITRKQIERGRSARAVAKETGVTFYTIGDYMRKHDWTMRAAAYDTHIDRLKREQSEAEIVKMHKFHAAAGTALIKRAMRRVLNLEDDEISTADVVRMIDKGVKIERISRGESTERQDIKQEHSGTITTKQVPVDLTSLSDEELDEFERLCRKVQPADAD